MPIFSTFKVAVSRLSSTKNVYDEIRDYGYATIVRDNVVICVCARVGFTRSSKCIAIESSRSNIYRSMCYLLSISRHQLSLFHKDS